ncbi:hypothetical protein N7495_003015 [Penicillium taxi]|uniref:uncharacterized protein n=1 Tax=Penicillium taxi TaxID=168475 RepID=UPI002545B9D3|nr:uncharacterized protein N7495_003015 [Penicillium taxi]KAJ5902487.1 hypothetical protein N7495_003015 [Penicillium taxi]
MDQQELLEVHSILHLIYHRNKNQHQRTKWWKWLSMLKRISLDLGSQDSDSVAAYRQHLAKLIPRCHLAFSTVVADKQFSTLGIVLVSTLARLAKVTGVDVELNARPMQKAKPKQKTQKTLVHTLSEDLGERVSRVGTADVLPESSKPQPVKPKFKDVEKSLEKTESTKRKKLGKKKKNAIDDLFSGLF